jgi:Protein of unknown function (DUF2975)
MKAVKGIASLFFYLTRLAALVYFLLAAYVGIVLLLSRLTSNLPIQIREEGFVIYYPFTKTPFFLGDYSAAYIVPTLLTILLYVFFIWLLSEVFNAFRGERLFIPQNVARLTRFYVLNLVGPVGCVLFLLIAGDIYSNAVIIALLHVLAGIFAFFMAAIFRQGLILQEEQDLTL